MQRIQFLFRPRFLSHPSASASKARGFGDLLAAWRHVLPGSVEDSTTDLEDWAENATVIQQAMRHSYKLDVFIDTKGSLDGVKPVEGCCTRAEFDAHEPFLFGGMQLRVGDFITSFGTVQFPTEHEVRASDRYPRNPGFLANANRRIAFAAYDDGGGDVEEAASLVNVLRQWHSEGHQQVFVKVAGAKNGVAILDLNGADSKGAVEAILHKTFEWTLVNMAGRKDGFMVQELVKMQHEYRVFVVDGVPVAGAACIEEFTPLDSRGEAFDTRTRADRVRREGADRSIQARPDIVGRYEQAAQAMAAAITDGCPYLRTFVMDLCLIGDDVSIVEINAARNAGMYALDFGRVLEATISSFALGRPHMDRKPIHGDLLQSLLAD